MRKQDTHVIPELSWAQNDGPRGGRRTPLCTVYLFKSSAKLLLLPGTKRHCNMAISNPVCKLEGLTQVGVTDVSTDNSDWRTKGGKYREQVCPSSEHP